MPKKPNPLDLEKLLRTKVGKSEKEANEIATAVQRALIEGLLAGGSVRLGDVCIIEKTHPKRARWHLRARWEKRLITLLEHYWGGREPKMPAGLKNLLLGNPCALPQDVVS